MTLRAGQVFETYLSRRDEELQCPSCGTETTVDSHPCGTTINARQHIAADFLVGAHAETADRMLTFDHGFFRDYFDVTVRAIDDCVSPKHT